MNPAALLPWTAVLWTAVAAGIFLYRLPVSWECHAALGSHLAGAFTPAALKVWPTHLAAAGGAALFFLAAGGLGRFWLKRWPVDGVGRAERLLLGIGIGAAGLAWAAYLAGAMGAFKPGVLVALLAFALTGWAVRLPAAAPAAHEPFPWVPALLLGVLALLAFLSALAPETFYDAQVYHLRVPDHYLRTGRVAYMDGNIYAQTPLAMSMVYAYGLVLGGSEATCLVNFGFAALAVAWVVAGFRPLWGRSAAWMAGAAAASVPQFFLLSAMSGAETALVFFTFGAFFSLLRGGGRWLMIAGLFTGFGFTVRYTHGFVGLGLAAVFIGEAMRSGRRPWREMGIFAAAAAAAALPGLLKTVLLTGDPVFPYLSSFQGDALAAVRHFREDAGSPARGWAYLAQFGKMHFEETALRVFPGPLALMFLPAALFLRPPDRPARFAIAAGAAAFLLGAFFSSLLRFFLPGFLLMVAAAVPVFRRYGGALRLALFTAAAAGMLLGAQAAVHKLYHRGNWRAAFPGPGRAMEYPFVSPLSNAYALANRALPLDAKVVVLGNPRGLGIDRESYVATVFDRHPVREWASGAADAEGLAAILRARGITHFIVGAETGAAQAKEKAMFPWSPAELRLWRGFWETHLENIYGAHDVFIYAVVPARRGPAPVFFPALWQALADGRGLEAWAQETYANPEEEASVRRLLARR